MASMDDNTFLTIRSRDDLASFLNIELKTLTMYAHSNKSFYDSFEIGKRSAGKRRLIHAPIPQLKRLQRVIAEELGKVYIPPSCVHGFVPGRSIVTNACHHVESPAILCLDLKDFFPSITANRVYGLFRSSPFSFPKEVASTLTEICCHEGSLPQGAPTSPVISNMICLRLDKQLSSFAHARKVFYTRYADDITFSSKSRKAVNRLLDTGHPEAPCRELLEIIEKNGLVVNAEKTHIARKTERQVVTGIVVNKKCNFPRDEYRVLRAVFHNWEKRGADYAAREYVIHDDSYRERLCLDGEDTPSEESFKRHIRGRLEYYSMIDSANAARSTSLERLWTMYYDRTGEPVSFSIPSRSVLSIHTAYDYKDILGRSVDFEADGSCFLTSDGRLITCKHCIANEGTPLELDDDCLCDLVDMKSGKTVCSVPVNSFERDMAHDFAVAPVPDALKGYPALMVDEINRPIVGQKVRALGVLFEHGGEVREIRCRIDLAHVDGAQYRVAAPFIKGMSGGPVIGLNGRVVGVVTKGSTPEDYFQDGYFLWLGAVLGKGSGHSNG